MSTNTVSAPARGKPAPKPGKANSTAAPIAGPESGLGQVAIKARAREMAEKEHAKMAAAKTKAAKTAEKQAKAAQLAKSKADRDIAKQNAKAERDAKRTAERELRNAPIPVTFETIGTRTLEIVRVFQTTGKSYTDAILNVEQAAKDAVLTAFPTIEPDFLVAKSVSDKTGKLAYTFFVRVTYINPFIPGWSGVKSAPKPE